MAQTARGSLCFRHGLKTVNFYDAQPRPAMAGFNRTLYSCVHNLQGDVVGIVDSAGSVVVEYRYDTVIELQFSPIPGYVYSNMYDRQIGENGHHVGVEYKGNVYCNVHPPGLPEQTWMNDFKAALNEPPDITRSSVILE